MCTHSCTIKNLTSLSIRDITSAITTDAMHVRILDLFSTCMLNVTRSAALHSGALWSRTETINSAYRLAVSQVHLSASIATHTHSVGSVPTQWRPLSLINTIVKSDLTPPADCCTPHSEVSDLWHKQPAGLCVFFCTLCLIFFYPLFQWEKHTAWGRSKAWKTLDIR